MLKVDYSLKMWITPHLRFFTIGITMVYAD